MTGRTRRHSDSHGPILITGGTGSIGRAVTRELATAGWCAIALGSPKTRPVAPPLRYEGVNSKRIIVSELDIAAPDARSFEIPSLTAVIHLAAITPSARCIPDDEATVRNLAMVRWALGMADKHRVPFVMASSAFIHDPHTEMPVTENSAIRPTTPYQLGKWHAEELCRTHRDRTALPTAWLRISAPYGPHTRHQTVITTFVSAATARDDLRFHGTGARTQDFVHFDDIATAFRLAVEARADGAFIIASGVSISMRELANLMASMVPGRPPSIVASGQDDPQERYRWSFDCSRARDELGYVPRVSLREGLQKLLSPRVGDA